MSSEIIVALIGLVGIIAGVIPTYVFMRKKEAAEIDKLYAETDKAKAEAEKIRAELQGKSSSDQMRQGPSNPGLERLKRLIGEWEGEIFTPEDRTTISGAVLTLTNNGGIINGSVSFDEPTRENESNKRTRTILSNGVFDGNVLKIEYENEKKYVYQPGTVVLEMSPGGDELSGYFVGYSPIFEKVISGEMRKFTKR